MTENSKVRMLLVADTPGHTVGYYVVSRGLMEAGIEVILGGYLNTEKIVAVAIQEDVDCIGYRIMDRDPVVLTRRLLDSLKEQHLDNVHVVVGGIVSPSDRPRLKELGIKGIFGPGSKIQDMAILIRQLKKEDKIKT